MSRRALLIILFSLIPDSTEARPHAGGEPFDFLFLEPGAVQAALGGAFTAGGGDSNAMALNPASLALQEENQVSFTHTKHFQDVVRQRVSAASRFGLAVSIDQVSYGETQRTTFSNPNGTGLGSYDAAAQCASLGFGFSPGEALALGFSGKVVRETIDASTGDAWAFDAGTQFTASEDPLWRLGVSVLNAGTKTRFDSKKEPLPLRVRWGSAVQFDLGESRIGLLTDLIQDPEGRILPSAGIAFVRPSGLSLRLGYNRRNDAGIGIAAGLGLRVGGFSFDYAFVPYGNLGASHMLSAGLRWGPNRVERLLPLVPGEESP